jgi:hypothetical protein
MPSGLGKYREQEERYLYGIDHAEVEEEEFLSLKNPSFPSRLGTGFLFLIVFCAAGALFGCVFYGGIDLLIYLKCLWETGFHSLSANVLYRVSTETHTPLPLFMIFTSLIFPGGLLGVWGVWRAVFKFENPFRYFMRRKRS